MKQELDLSDCKFSAVNDLVTRLYQEVEKDETPRSIRGLVRIPRTLAVHLPNGMAGIRVLRTQLSYRTALTRVNFWYVADMKPKEGMRAYVVGLDVLSPLEALLE